MEENRLLALGANETASKYQETAWEEQEVALIERGDHDEIMAYVNCHFLTRAAYKKLLERGNYEELKAERDRDDLS